MDPDEYVREPRDGWHPPEHKPLPLLRWRPRGTWVCYERGSTGNSTATLLCSQVGRRRIASAKRIASPCRMKTSCLTMNPRLPRQTFKFLAVRRYPNIVGPTIRAETGNPALPRRNHSGRSLRQLLSTAWTFHGNLLATPRPSTKSASFWRTIRQRQ